MTCDACGTELSSSRLTCPACHQLVHGEELSRLAAEAGGAREQDDVDTELAAWRRALELLPPDAEQHRTIATRAGELS